MLSHSPKSRSGTAGSARRWRSTRSAGAEDSAETGVELFEQIGRLKMELEWVKKKVGVLG